MSKCCPFASVAGRMVHPASSRNIIVGNGYNTHLCSFTYVTADMLIQQLKQYISDEFMIIDDEDGYGLAIYVNPKILNGYQIDELKQKMLSLNSSYKTSKNSEAKQIIELFEE